MRETAVDHSFLLFLSVCLVFIPDESRRLRCSSFMTHPKCTCRASPVLQGPPAQASSRIPCAGELSEQLPDDARTFSQTSAKFYCMAECLKFVQMSRTPYAGLHLSVRSACSLQLTSLAQGINEGANILFSLDCVALRFLALAVWHVQTPVLQGPPAQAAGFLVPKSFESNGQMMPKPFLTNKLHAIIQPSSF